MDKRWEVIENRWIRIIKRQSGDSSIQWINPQEHLSYQPPEAPFEIYREDFAKMMLDYETFQNRDDCKKYMKVVDTDKWKRFEISELFDVFATHYLPRRQIVKDSGVVPYVTTSYVNNGVASYISCDESVIESGNVIMIAAKTQVVTYQPMDFVSGDSHNLILRIKNEMYRTERVQLFLFCAIKTCLAGKYSWDNSLTKESVLKEKIYLPVDDNGDPDYLYMEEMKEKIDKEFVSLWALR